MTIDFTALALPGVQTLRPYQPGKPIEELERELSIKNSLKLASNENPLGASPMAQAALAAEMARLQLYPDGGGFALRAGLAAKLGFDAACFTLGNGSNDVLELVARAFLGPGREAIFSEHAFAVYPLVSQAAGATLRMIPALKDAEQGPLYGHDLSAMLAAVNANTRVIFIANPNNPTGTWLKREDLLTFLQQVPENVVVVIDEAYFEYVSESDYPDALQWLADFPNLIVTRTFSKIYGLAALRVGYSVSSPQLADLLNRVRQPFNCNSMAQAAALAALDDDAHVMQSKAVNDAGLQQLSTAFAARGWDYIASVGNFMCVDVGRDAMTVYEALLREAVIVRPVANYALPQHLRITVSTEADNQRVLAALDKVLAC